MEEDHKLEIGQELPWHLIINCEQMNQALSTRDLRASDSGRVRPSFSLDASAGLILDTARRTRSFQRSHVANFILRIGPNDLSTSRPTGRTRYLSY